MKRTKRILFVFLIISLCIGADQLTQQIVKSDLPKTKPIVLVKSMLQLDYIENSGGVFSFELLLPRQWRGKTVTAAAALLLTLCVLLITASRRLHFLPLLGISLFCGGSLSNLIDRIVCGSIVDFIHFNALGLQPFIFNLADAAIASGITLAIIGLVIQAGRIVLL